MAHLQQHAQQRQHRFDDEGKLMRNALQPLSIDESETSSSTPPDDAFIHCSLTDYLAVPLDFLLTNVKNSGEADLLFGIGCVASDIDMLLSRMEEQILDHVRIQRIRAELLDSANSMVNNLSLNLIGECSFVWHCCIQSSDLYDRASQMVQRISFAQTCSGIGTASRTFNRFSGPLDSIHGD